jgi:hypothetical protein
MKPMTTMQAEWEDFMRAIHGHHPISELQRREMHRAFFAGAVSLRNLMDSMAEIKDDEQAANAYGKVYEEIETVLRDIIHTARNRQ